MPLYMYDAATCPSLSLAKSRGAIAMSHYMTRSYAGSSAQPGATRSYGMGAVQNWEGMANELVGASRTKGQNIGKEILAAARAAGQPLDGTIGAYCSVDVAIYGAPYSDCDNGFQGLNDALHGLMKVKVYGELAVIDHLVGQGLVQGKQWLSMSESFPGFRNAWTHVAMVQMHDAQGRWIDTDIPNTDRNTILDPYALDAWWPTGSPYAQGEPPMTPQERQELVAEFWNTQFPDPNDPTGKRTYSARQYLLTSYKNSTSAKSALATIVDKVSVAAGSVDPAAVAKAIQAKLLSMIAGGTP